jgi:hypothetical protein
MSATRTGVRTLGVVTPTPGGADAGLATIDGRSPGGRSPGGRSPGGAGMLLSPDGTPYPHRYRSISRKASIH